MIIAFPGKKKPGSPLGAKEVETIYFDTFDDRNLYIDDPVSISKIMAFIVKEKIKITEGE